MIELRMLLERFVQRYQYLTPSDRPRTILGRVYEIYGLRILKCLFGFQITR